MFFLQKGGEGAVVVGVWQDELLFDECEIRMGVEEFLYLQVVLLRFDGACAVDEAAVRFDGQRGLMEDFRLDDGEFRKLLEVERPFGVRFAAENACVGAWDVQKDGVQRGGRLELRGVHLRDGYAGEAFQIFLKPRKLRFRNVIRVENARVFQRFRQQDGLAAGRGAEVGDDFAWPGGEKRRRKQCRRILDIKFRIGAKDFRDGYMGLPVQFVEFGVWRPFGRFDGQDAFDAFRRLLRRIFTKAEERVRLLKKAFGDGGRRLLSVMILPATPEDFRKTEADVLRRVVKEMVFAEAKRIMDADEGKSNGTVAMAA